MPAARLTNYHTLLNMTEHNQIYPPDDASQQAFFTQASQNPSQLHDDHQNDDINLGAPYRQNLAFHNSDFSPFSQAGLVYRPHSPHVFGLPHSPHTIPSSSVSPSSPTPAWVQPDVKPGAKPTAKRARGLDSPAPSKAAPPHFKTAEYLGLANALVELKPYGALHGKKGEAWDGIAAHLKGKGMFLTSSPDTIKNKATALLKYQEVRTCCLVLLVYY
jgi:hypothetical protein